MFNTEKKGLYDRAFEHDSCGIGFVAHIRGQKSNDIIKRGLEVLERMSHRGAEGADNKTGDGSGILMQIPHSFYKKTVKDLPEAGSYGTGLVFLPRDKKDAQLCIDEISEVIKSENHKIAAWRDIKTDSSKIGNIAQMSEPQIRQIFITGAERQDQATLERKLYIIRKVIESRIRNRSIAGRSAFYIPSLSSRTIVYKGMLTPGQVREYFEDLRDEGLESAIALVHSRFSTNTFPSWDLAQPFRIVAHNGEINTIKGNRFWMSARESYFESDLIGDDIKKILPVIEPGKSDSASFDNALEMLVAMGRSLPHAIMMLIPESWNEKNPISDDLKYFYEYHATFMEPWDGPASMVFCDGRYVGGILDRNGLRPSRYVITKDDLIVMGSEVGVQNFPPEKIAYNGRLMPGKLLFVDTVEGIIIPDHEIKDGICRSRPYRQWVDNNRIDIASIQLESEAGVSIQEDKLRKLKHIYGYTREDIEDIITEMAVTAQEPTSSMGTDTPLAVFSDKPQRLFNYFKQSFAQVTNPAIDPIREELVMTLTTFLGDQKNLLSETAAHCRSIKLLNPVITNTELKKIKSLDTQNFKSASLPMVFKKDKGIKGIEEAMDELSRKAEALIDGGCSIIILSDRTADEYNIPIPSLLACSGIHHHLIRVKKRTKTSLIIESAEPREVMHFALLFGYGASAINPYGAVAIICELHGRKKLPGISHFETAQDNYIKALNKGILKVLSKMGTSTLRSYRGAQIFEALGLDREMTEKYFTGTESRISGIGLPEIALEAIAHHDRAYTGKKALLESEGVYQYRKSGENHAWNPEAIHLLQLAVRTNRYDNYKKFADSVNGYNRKPNVIRGLFEFKSQVPVPVDEVESPDKIFKRFNTGAMSFGSISIEVHEAIAKAMNAIGGRSNSGEGGENPERFQRLPDGTLARSAIKQVASGRFGVTIHYLVNADEIQIKISQGAKPGEGGQLPGHKVDRHIGKTRHSTPGVSLISPPPHHDIYSIEDLAQLIFDLKNANPSARISVKLVSETGVGTVAAGVAKAHADNIVISGYDGGTGASPLSSIKHAGIPFEIGLSETHQTLVMNNLRGRVILQTDGQLKTGRDIVLAAMLGADEFAFGTAALIIMGCIMMRKCHLNTCPVGVATQDPELRKKFRGKPEYLVNYFTFMVQEVREIMAQLGIRKFDELIGRTDLLEIRKIDHWKAKTVDPSLLLFRPEESSMYATHCCEKQIHKIDNVLDRTLIDNCREALDHKKIVSLEMPIINRDRAVGTMLSGQIALRYGDEGLADDTIQCTFTGSAGQSFGAFLSRGVTFRLEGDSNDYFGKGLSGGKLIAVPPKRSNFVPENNIIVGNTVLYGATSGETFIRGIAGERFCVRNSGAIAVVEGTGDHCAEYMTGGRIIVLGKVGRNFASGMSGGIAYVYNVDGNFHYFCNKGMVELSPILEFEDQEFIKKWLIKHIEYTGSTVAEKILKFWHENMPKFIKVMPLEYKRALQEMKIEELDNKLKAIRENEQLGVSI